MNSLAEQIIADILAEEMALPAGSIWVRDQNKVIPNDSGTYIIVGFVDGQPVGVETYQNAVASLIAPTEPYFSDDSTSKSYFSDDDENDRMNSAGGFIDLIPDPLFSHNQDIQQYFSDDAQAQSYLTGYSDSVYLSEKTVVQMRENIQISILSRSNAAIMRHWEIIGALQSLYSEQAQEANSFKIFRIPQSFVNASSAEGGSTLNRFSITVSAFVWYYKERVLPRTGGDFYDDFTTRVDDAITISAPNGIFEFEIKGDQIDGNPPGQ